jgi:hypothetical protein
MSILGIFDFAFLSLLYHKMYDDEIIELQTLHSIISKEARLLYKKRDYFNALKKQKQSHEIYLLLEKKIKT